MNKVVLLATLASVITLAGCSSTSNIDNSAGRATVYEDARSPGKVQGVGVESQDIMAVTDQMMRDMLSNPQLVSRDVAPRIIIDSQYFTNESSSRINKNMLTDRLRINLNRASNGRLVFVGREYADMVEKERELKRMGVVDGGTIRATQATAGADFRLVGRIMSLDAMDTRSQERSRYHQITFELVDLELGTYVWSGMYEFQKTAQDDVIYR
ncbi:penicillin-binding protein activator LpoB [Pseudidiomarina gelatinasegens]|jgi:PBP1b-binding outer membrane lipoprotein LpoB|uniref:Penicillin-binding protein activator LpoB n=1 Tax=Pseudidiomarina gelatinasegens TaxID=2487740 RepID=A0A443Z7Y9_9GAMM|nr:penicillin-binding protein activator LpoB [Pseudidiomarina gelatinasegens]RWU13047.1 penicillin-binding protein activator LpoB [Pseudidiomarina gelatinasegens]|tara:strand:+ start:422 stop:1057 length:636 start_codon:yes stop_codon:yes gene_type:complete